MEEIVLVVRLIPLRFEYGIELIEEMDTLRSREPARWMEIHLLLTSFDDEFESSERAVDAIKLGKLMNPVRSLCRSIHCFPRGKSQVCKGSEILPGHERF